MRKKLKELKPVLNGVGRLECRAYKKCIGLGGSEKNCTHVWRRKAKNIRVQLSVTYSMPFAERDTDTDNLILSREEEYPTSSSTIPGRRTVTVPLASGSAMSSSEGSQTATVRKRRTATEIENISKKSIASGSHYSFHCFHCPREPQLVMYCFRIPRKATVLSGIQMFVAMCLVRLKFYHEGNALRNVLLKPHILCTWF
jgi:hypothetical protein